MPPGGGMGGMGGMAVWAVWAAGIRRLTKGQSGPSASRAHTLTLVIRPSSVLSCPILAAASCALLTFHHQVCIRSMLHPSAEAMRRLAAEDIDN